MVEIIFTYKKICKIFAFRMSICLQLNENCLDENGLQYTVSENVPPKKRIKNKRMLVLLKIPAKKKKI